MSGIRAEERTGGREAGQARLGGGVRTRRVGSKFGTIPDADVRLERRSGAEDWEVAESRDV